MQKTIYYIVFIIFFGGCVNAQDKPVKKTTVDAAVREFVNASDFKNSSLSFFAVDIDSQQTIIEVNADQSLITASIMKVVSTATSLIALGEDYRFETILEYDGNFDKSTGTLNGNLYIRGGGDPTLGSRRFMNSTFIEKWSKAISDFGIKKIDGAIIGDARFFEDQMIPDGFAWLDIGNYYGAGASGLSVYENTYRISFKSEAEAEKPTTIADVTPEIPGLEFDNFVVSSDINRDLVYIYGAPYSYNRVCRGSVPKNKAAFVVKGSIPDPAFLAAHQLTEKLKANNIAIENKPNTVRALLIDGNYEETECKKIHTTKSPALKHIITQTNLHSVNIFAEHLMKMAGKKLLDEGSLEKGIEATKELWNEKGMDTDGFYISDGSGLSRSNALTTRQMVFILEAMKKDSVHGGVFEQSLPIAGVSGTLRSFGKGTIVENKVKAKSGSIGNVRSYAGYAETSSGRNIAFAVIVNNFPCSGSEVKRKIVEVMKAVCAL